MRVTRRLAHARARLVPGEPSQPGREGDGGRHTSPVARVSTPAGLVVGIPDGGRLVFGRGPDADLTIAAGRVCPAVRA